MALNPSKARELLLALSNAQDDQNIRAAADRVLNFLLNQLEELRELANGYPANPISAAVWMDGTALTQLCDELTALLAVKALPNQQELASRLAVGMACQVMGHYPEQIFPRILRNSRCREGISHLDEAIGGYEAIVADFSEMGLDDLLDDRGPLDESARVVLESVHDAAERLGELQPERQAGLQSLQLDVKRRLNE